MSFLGLSILDVLDIALAAFLLYQIYRIIKGTAAIRIFIGIAAVYLTWKLVDAFHMDVLTEILGQFIGVGFLLLVIVFQQEIRRFLLVIGTATFSRRRRFFKQLLMLRKKEKADNSKVLDPIILACQNMCDNKTGALIVLVQNTPISNYAQTGTRLDAEISTTLIESIFFKNAPLHDGAMIISNGRIEAAGAILPVSDNDAVPARYGLRHRAALGVSEKSDAITIVVSEETGGLVIAQNGHLQPLEVGELKSKLNKYLEKN